MAFFSRIRAGGFALGVCPTQVRQTPRGIELYFPPLRTPGAALALALFGAACLVPGLFAAATVVPASGSDSAGLLAFWLMSAFLLPFIAFGLLFLGFSVYRLANSLTVNVTEAGIRSRRRVFGLRLRERRVARSDIAAIEPVAAPRLRGEVPFYSLVARTASGSGLTLGEAYRTGRLHDYCNRSVTVAESLRGEALMEEVKAEIIKAAGLADLAAPRTSDP